LLDVFCGTSKGAAENRERRLNEAQMAKVTKWLDGFTLWVMKWAKWNNPFLMCLIVFEVFMRYVVNRPTIWGADILTMMSAFGRLVGIGYGSMVRAHVVMDIFTAKLDFKKSKILDLINFIVFFLPLITALAYTTFKRAVKSYKWHETIYSGWRPIIWPVVFLVVGCYVILLLQGVSEILKDIISLQKGSDEWIKER